MEIKTDGEGIGQGRFLRTRIEVDIMKPLARGKWLTVKEKKMHMHFKYEHLSTFCFQCGVVIKHRKRVSPKWKPQMNSVNGLNAQYGPWLKANPTKMRDSIVKKDNRNTGQKVQHDWNQQNSGENSSKKYENY